MLHVRQTQGSEFQKTINFTIYEGNNTVYDLITLVFRVACWKKKMLPVAQRNPRDSHRQLWSSLICDVIYPIYLSMMSA